MQCPECGSLSRRDGKTRNKQRWECKNPQCNYHYVQDAAPVGAPRTAVRVNPPCPYCGGILHKRSRRKSTQYYQCRDCGIGSCSSIL